MRTGGSESLVTVGAPLQLPPQPAPLYAKYLNTHMWMCVCVSMCRIGGFVVAPYEWFTWIPLSYWKLFILKILDFNGKKQWNDILTHIYIYIYIYTTNEYIHMCVTLNCATAMRSFRTLYRVLIDFSTSQIPHCDTLTLFRTKQSNMNARITAVLNLHCAPCRPLALTGT